ncbi:iron ABC transporter permease [Pseudorhodoferax sp. Leaf274]|uniref:FecCD family ABC transporter permease n=1 Tax=Pseudorhodoferax sp. Leaf274 TaxID=1736318 RepID=UPI000702A69F|nr:iron ABC transporter permease [Pseudorhodoferax sp. Leaf274]KQP44680.1 cobalamin ABC transporter permease [Pseudorhodoferax sp. Leaf274]
MTIAHPSVLTPLGRQNTASRAVVCFTALGLLVLALFTAELMLGAVPIPLGAVLQALVCDPGGSQVWRDIVLAFRLPRALNAVFSGAALGVAGLLLQTLFRNPLADPFVLGIVHGARLGSAMLVTLAGVVGHAFLVRFGLVGDVGLALASVAGSVAVLALLAALSQRIGTVTLLIVGLMLGYLAVGLISVLMHFIDETQARAFKAWDDASFAGATRQQLQILVPGVGAGLAACAALVKPLNGLLLGERYAASMGMRVGLVKRMALLTTAWLSGLVSAFCGPVAFLGLVAAQVARAMMRSADHRVLIPAAALVGSSLGLAADLVMHLPWSRHVFHLNAVIGLVGAPLALWMLYRTRAMQQVD